MSFLLLSLEKAEITDVQLQSFWQFVKKKKGFKVSFFRVKYDIKNQKIHQFYTSFLLLNFFFLNFCLTLKYLAVKGYVVLDFIILRGVSHILPALVIVNEKDKQIETTLTTM